MIVTILFFMVGIITSKYRKRKDNGKTKIVCGLRSRRNLSSVSRTSAVSEVEEFNPFLSETEMKVGTRLGVDSHADTCCVNKHAYVETVVEGITVDAIPFDQRIGRLSNLNIVHAIYAIDNQSTFETNLVRLNHSIYIKDMEHPLLCPNQAREYGCIVDDVPVHLDHTGQSTFSLHVQDKSFPFEAFGPTAYLQVRRPTDEELHSLPVLDITNEHGWEPYGDITKEDISSLISRVSVEDHAPYEHPLDDRLQREIIHVEKLRFIFSKSSGALPVQICTINFSIQVPFSISIYIALMVEGIS